ncbi:unnamed protein product, partial [Tilletia controversa]
MAVAYDEGVIIGADSRTTMGSPNCSKPNPPGELTIHSFSTNLPQANRVTDKLTHITDRIYCCRSGSAADTQAVADAVTHHLSLVDVLHGPPEVSTAAHLFSEIVYQNKDRLSAGIIVARWDKRNGGTVYNVTLGGGSGSTYIYGYCDSTYRPGWN